MDRVRKPAVAGTFYPSDPEDLRRTAAGMLSGRGEEEALGVVVPHAGFIYSGPVAGHVFGTVRVPEVVVLLGPNHWGTGPGVAVPEARGMATPLGDVPVHAGAASAFLAACPSARKDDRSHRAEHSLEVQLPFLQLVRGDRPLSVLPILLATNDDDALHEVAAALVGLLEGEVQGALLVASSDMSHYVPEATARARDREAIREMERLDGEGLRDVCVREGVSMCGVAAAMVVMEACRSLGASGGRLLRYATSADAGGDPQEVVGYAGLMIH